MDFFFAMAFHLPLFLLNLLPLSKAEHMKGVYTLKNAVLNTTKHWVKYGYPISINIHISPSAGLYLTQHYLECMVVWTT